MKKAYKITPIFLIFVFTILLSGCSKVDDLKVKMGLKNKDFEIIKQNKVEKIVIQSTRDQGYRFVVTDKKTIGRLYDILSTAKTTTGKSSLQADYILEIDEGENKISKFNYVAGIDKKEGGNLYSDDKVYLVSKRLDNDIIKSFWNIKKPKDFKYIYYTSILETMNRYFEEGDKSKKIGINIEDDVEASKFIISIDVLDFKDKLSGKYKNSNITNKDKENYDVLVNIKTQGYKTTSYKAIITILNKQEKSEKKYYIYNKLENGRWEIKISENKPENF